VTTAPEPSATCAAALAACTAAAEAHGDAVGFDGTPEDGCEAADEPQCDAPPPDCSFTSGEPASCGAGCGYSAARPNRTSASWPLALGSAVFTSWKNASSAFAVDVSLPRSLAEKQARSLVSQTCSAISAASIENCSTVEHFY
jgi:hypothetical protein